MSQVPCVILRHDDPRGAHFDWLIATRPGPDEPDERCLIAFRSVVRPDGPPPSPASMTRLPDHRARYLTYEGELSGGRGTVSRVAEGDCLIHENTPSRLVLDARFGPFTARFEGERVGDDAEQAPQGAWLFNVTAGDRSGR